MVGDGTINCMALPPDRPTVTQQILRTWRCVITYGAVEAGPDRSVAKVDIPAVLKNFESKDPPAIRSK